jgi:hypothetical protein
MDAGRLGEERDEALFYLTLATWRCLPALRQRVQILSRPPAGKAAHWRLGYLRVLPVGLYLVARTLLE